MKYANQENTVVNWTDDRGSHSASIEDDRVIAWLAEGNTPEPADQPPPDIRQEILSLSQKALGSGFLHIMMLDMMQRYLSQAQSIVPTVTEADLLNPQSQYYSKPYADTKVYYDQLVALQDLK